MKEAKKVNRIMFQGTASHVGKSLLTAALCRILKDRGDNVAPFKAQNMALNSAVTPSGGEIGRAQAFQAKASRVAPSIDMNPVLLKPTGESVAQVIIHGKVHSDMSARVFHAFKKEAAGFVLESYARLADTYDTIVIEGAGSPAEINLRENDIVNMGLAEMVDAPVIIVADIDRGGVFASLVGTIELLSPEERTRVKGFIINKFRGDKTLLTPAIEFLEERTGKPVLGVVPMVTGLVLPEEDGVAIEGASEHHSARDNNEAIKIAVIKTPRISNFTDFDPLSASADVELFYVHGSSGIEDLQDADIVILPGSKHVIGDMKWLKENGIARALIKFAGLGGRIFGICGGFQMLGVSIKDPDGVEGERGVEETGLALLDVVTVLRTDKCTFTVKAGAGTGGGGEISGYEIHMGETLSNEAPFTTITERNLAAVEISDGAVSKNGLVSGTYIHGLFDNDTYREEFLGTLRELKGLEGSGVSAIPGESFSDIIEASIDTVADVFKENVDMETLFKIIEG